MPATIAGLLDIRYPLISAPMGHISGGRLAGAVSGAGGLGMIGPGYLDASWIEREFHAAGSARVGVGFITWDLARTPARLEAALAFRPVAVMLSFGDPAPFVEQIRRAGAKLFLQVQTVAAAEAAAALEPDLIVAQGTEAGGHCGERGLLPLLPAVVDRVGPIPVVAAGGICDGRGIAAAFALGASGVLVGTRFYVAEESLAAPAAKHRVVRGSGDATVRTRVFDVARRLPWPAQFAGRAIRNGFTDRWHSNEAALEKSLDEEQPRYAAAVAAEDFDTAAVWAGEGIDLIQGIAPASRIVEQLMAEADAAARAAFMAYPGPG